MQHKNKLFGSFDDVSGKGDTHSFRWWTSRLLYNGSGTCAEWSTMKAASSDAINGFVHIEGKEISLGDYLQLVAGRAAEVDV